MENLFNNIIDNNDSVLTDYYTDKKERFDILFNMLIGIKIISKDNIIELISLYNKHGLTKQIDNDKFLNTIKYILSILKSNNIKPLTLNFIDTSNINNMDNLFKNYYGINDLDISDWNVSNVISMRYMFYNSDFNNDISNWNVSNVNDFAYMFCDNTHFNKDLSKWNLKQYDKLINVSNMFLHTNLEQIKYPY